MDSTDFLSRVKELASQAATSKDCLLYDLEFVGRGKGRVLRVYIDKQGGNVDVSDCAKVSNEINLLLDTEDVIPGGPYNLEVSSPGLERNLKEFWQFEMAVGRQIWVKLTATLSELGIDLKKFKASKVITAELLGCDDKKVKLFAEEQEIEIPFEKIEKAKTVFDFDDKLASAKR